MQICTLTQTHNHASIPPLSFLQAECPSCCPTNSVKAGRTQSFVHCGHQTSDYPVECSIPLGSVLGPLKFVAYTENGTDTINQHAVHSHSYADDTQLYASSTPNDVSSIHQRLSDCSSDFMSWCTARRLQLNADKTEVMWVGS